MSSASTWTLQIKLLNFNLKQDLVALITQTYWVDVDFEANLNQISVVTSGCLFDSLLEAFQALLSDFRVAIRPGKYFWGWLVWVDEFHFVRRFFFLLINLYSERGFFLLLVYLLVAVRPGKYLLIIPDNFHFDWFLFTDFLAAMSSWSCDNVTQFVCPSVRVLFLISFTSIVAKVI